VAPQVVSQEIAIESHLVDITPPAWTVTGTPSRLTGVIGEQQIISDYTLDE
jgi:hypothetical protein